jgi:hypothetical protein
MIVKMKLIKSKPEYKSDPYSWVCKIEKIFSYYFRYSFLFLYKIIEISNFCNLFSCYYIKWINISYYEFVAKKLLHGFVVIERPLFASRESSQIASFDWG